MARIGIIGDTHLPFEREGYAEWCKATFRKHKVNKVIHIGDLVDHHSLSFHESEPMLHGAQGELMTVQSKLKKWFKLFPQLTLIMGNHDKIPQRQLKKIGMDGPTWMRPLKEVYNMPAGWEVVMDYTMDGVYFHHGETALGVNGFRSDAQARMCNTVMGHAHGNAGISATACDHRLVWGMAVGCGVDAKHMAFAYGKNFKLKPIIACGLVLDGEPMVKYMDLGER